MDALGDKFLPFRSIDQKIIPVAFDLSGSVDGQDLRREPSAHRSLRHEAYERLVLAEIFLADFLQDPVAGKIIIQGPGIMEKHDAQRGQWILYLSYDILALDIQGCVGP